MNETESPKDNVPEIVRGLMRDRSTLVSAMTNAILGSHPVGDVLKAEIDAIDRRVAVLIGYGEDSRLSVRMPAPCADPEVGERERLKQGLLARCRALTFEPCACGGKADAQMILVGGFYFEVMCAKCFKSTGRCDTPEEAAAAWAARKDQL